MTIIIDLMKFRLKGARDKIARKKRGEMSSEGNHPKVVDTMRRIRGDEKEENHPKLIETMARIKKEREKKEREKEL